MPAAPPRPVKAVCIACMCACRIPIARRLCVCMLAALQCVVQLEAGVGGGWMGACAAGSLQDVCVCTRGRRVTRGCRSVLCSTGGPVAFVLFFRGVDRFFGGAACPEASSLLAGDFVGLWLSVSCYQIQLTRRALFETMGWRISLQQQTVLSGDGVVCWSLLDSAVAHCLGAFSVLHHSCGWS